MTAAWLWGRSELRARWRSWVILGVLAGATFGLAAAGFAGARRTSVALPRFVEVAHFPTAALLANDPKFDAAKQRAVAALPEVQRVYPFEIAISLVDKPINDGGGLIPTTDASAQLFSVPLVEGRKTNPARADEIVVDQNLQRQFHLDVGAIVTLGQSIPPDAVASIPPGMLAPGVDPNFEQKLTVVGISKSVNSDASWAPSAGFYAKYGHRLAGFVNEFTTLRRGEADLPRFERDVERIIGHPVNVESFAQLLGIPKTRNLLRVERDGLLLFALAVLLVGGVLIGQALARAVGASAADLPTWRAIGADRGMALRALVTPAILTALVGVVTAIGVAIALSPRFPISQARRFDLDVGVHADWLVLGLAAAAVIVAVMAVAIVSALWAATGRRTSDGSPSWAGKWAARLGLPPALAIGSRLAVEPGRGRRAVPVRSALIGAVVGVVGVVGCFTFRAGLTDAAASPQRSGIVWDFEIASGEGAVAAKDLATIAHDHEVRGALHAAWFRAVRVNGVATPTWGTETLKGDTTPVVLTGRAPEARDEIALGPATAKSLKLHIGDHVSVGDAVKTRATVVGTALVPASSHTDYDQGGWMTDAGLRAALKSSHQLDVNDYEDYVFVRWAPGTDVKAAEHRYASLHPGSDAWFTNAATLPVQIVSLGELRSLPLWLGVFFALLASATVAHALVTTVRRRRQELAVLRSIGFTRRQARVAIGWQATLIALVGLIVGMPIGIATGRLVWRWLADSFPVVYVSPLALVAVVLVVPVAIVVANLLAAVPARSAARIRPAEALRVE
jgi:ABC-type lipoprotein release transport system permease subunit